MVTSLVFIMGLKKTKLTFVEGFIILGAGAFISELTFQSCETLHSWSLVEAIPEIRPAFLNIDYNY